MAGQARVLRVIAGCESPLIIAARAGPVPLRPTWRRPPFNSGSDRKFVRGRGLRLACSARCIRWAQPDGRQRE
jgi:hypothetical protein